MHHNFLIHFTIEENLYCFEFLTVLYCATVKINEEISRW